jgi:hypothetical protein
MLNKSHKCAMHTVAQLWAAAAYGLACPVYFNVMHVMLW